MANSPLKFTILKNGNLRISLLHGNKRNLKELINNPNMGSDDQAFTEATERYWTNGWFITTADRLGEMTECLVICQDGNIEDDGSITLYGNAWYNFHNYMVVNPLEEILEKGYIDFGFWANWDNQNFPNSYVR